MSKIREGNGLVGNKGRKHMVNTNKMSQKTKKCPNSIDSAKNKCIMYGKERDKKIKRA